VKLERPLIQPSVLRSLRRLRDPSCFRSFAVWLMSGQSGPYSRYCIEQHCFSRLQFSGNVHDFGQLKTSSRTPPSYPALVSSPFLNKPDRRSAKERRLTSCGRLMKEDKSLRISGCR